MEWQYNTNPITYLTGDFDGKNSDQVIAKDSYGKLYLAVFNNGFIDGSHFEEWYDDRGFEIDKKIVAFCKIPY